MKGADNTIELVPIISQLTYVHIAKKRKKRQICITIAHVSFPLSSLIFQSRVNKDFEANNVV